MNVIIQILYAKKINYERYTIYKLSLFSKNRVSGFLKHFEVNASVMSDINDSSGFFAYLTASIIFLAGIYNLVSIRCVIDR